MTHLVELQVERPELPAISSRGSELIEIEDRDSYEYAVSFCTDMKSKYDEIEKKRVELKAPILAAGKAIDGFFKPALEFFESEIRTVKNKLSVYIQAERKREDEKLRAAQQAADEERARLLAEAVAAKQAGDKEAAKALREQAAVTTAVVDAPTDMKTGASHTRKDWVVEIVDEEAFIKAALKDKMLFAACVEIKVGPLKKRIAAGGKIPPGVKAEQVEAVVLGKGEVF